MDIYISTSYVQNKFNYHLLSTAVPMRVEVKQAVGVKNLGRKSSHISALYILVCSLVFNKNMTGTQDYLYLQQNISNHSIGTCKCHRILINLKSCVIIYICRTWTSSHNRGKHFNGRPNRNWTLSCFMYPVIQIYYIHLFIE